MQRWITYAALVLVGGATQPFAADTVAPNDNRRAAGTLEKGVLTVSLEARSGRWYPEGEGGRALELAAFAEEGKALTNPGPLIRVPVGTTVRATIRNRLDKPLTVFGFGKTRGMSDSVIVPVGARSAVSFTATTPGTYYYVARRDPDPLTGFRAIEDTQLAGVIIVDPPNVKPIPEERTFAMTFACGVDPASTSGLGRCTMAINGLSWPHTEHLAYSQGDSIRWRVINFTEIDHPMHLHGFFFRVDSKGDGVVDSVYTPAQRRMGVTEVMAPFRTISIAWKAERPGNWIFHCHYATHLSDLASLDTEKGSHDSTMTGHHTSDRPHQMYGLVMGISIAPKGPAATVSGPERKIRIVQRQKPNVYGSQPGMSFVVDGTPEASDPNAMPVPGPTLVLERGKPVAVTIVNQSNDHAAIHWHGIELESYPDGVPGWSGSGKDLLPSIAPHDSLTVRWTPPRTGSYMYHSHFREAAQMGGGLYGPIIVVEPGQRFDPETDRILFFGTAGHTVNPIFGPLPGFLMNGKAQPDAMNLEAGTRYRFRLFNLAGDTPLLVSLNAGDAPVQWRAVAKDGYPLPASQATQKPAVLLFDPGEIYDFELTPSAPGELTLKFGLPPFITNPPPPPAGPNLPFAPLPPTITVPIHVHSTAR
jgi:FtsP/CotA-like multicopper oxidase with cupredoxin domain